MNKTARLAAGAALLGITAFTGQAAAEDHVVKLRNADGKGEYMLFEPDFLKVSTGDTITFVPVDKGHNAEMIPEVWPEGAEKFKGDFNEESWLTVEKPGVYGIKCLPHYTMGMVMMIVADEPTNLEQAKSFKAPGGAAKRFNKLKEKLASN